MPLNRLHVWIPSFSVQFPVLFLSVLPFSHLCAVCLTGLLLFLVSSFSFSFENLMLLWKKFWNYTSAYLMLEKWHESASVLLQLHNCFESGDILLPFLCVVGLSGLAPTSFLSCLSKVPVVIDRGALAQFLLLYMFAFFPLHRPDMSQSLFFFWPPDPITPPSGLTHYLQLLLHTFERERDHVTFSS